MGSNKLIKLLERVSTTCTYFLVLHTLKQVSRSMSAVSTGTFPSCVKTKVFSNFEIRLPATYFYYTGESINESGKGLVNYWKAHKIDFAVARSFIINNYLIKITFY